MALKTPACKDAPVDSEAAQTEDDADDDDDAPTPKHWSSDWEPTLNSLLSTYVLDSALLQCTDKRVRSTSLYHCRQCSIVLKPRSDRIDYGVVCFMTHDCSRKLRNTVRPVRAECGLSVYTVVLSFVEVIETQ